MISAVLAMVVASCADSVESQLASTVTGVVANPDAAPSGVVSLKDASVSTMEVAARTGAGGTFAVDVSGLTPPFLLRTEVTDGTTTTRLYALSSGGAVSINPLTNAVVSGAAGGIDPDVLYVRDDPAELRSAAERAAPIASELALALAPLLDLYGVTDPVDDVSPAGADALRAMLTDVRVEVSPPKVIVTNRETQAVIFDGPSTAPSTGTFVAANLPSGAPPPPPPPPTRARTYPPLVKMVKYAQPAGALPALGASITNVFDPLDARQNTVTTRITDLLSYYPKSAVWNADETLALVGPTPGTWTAYPRYVVKDGTTFANVRAIDTGAYPTEHRQWSNLDPRYIYGVRHADKQWVRVDATNPANNRVLRTYTAAEFGLSTLNYITFGSFEGNMDDNDTGAVIVGSSASYADSDMRTAILIDPKTGAPRCRITGGGAYGNPINDATMSHDGRYIIVAYGPGGGPIDVYDASDCSYARRMSADAAHYDACVSSAGEQVIVMYRVSRITMFRLSDGQQTVVYEDNNYMPGFVSCRNTKRPGYAYVSWSSNVCDSSWFNLVGVNRVFALKLDGSRQVENYAWDHAACPPTEAGMPMAIPSRWGDRVWFRSQSGVVGGPAASYLARKP